MSTTIVVKTQKGRCHVLPCSLSSSGTSRTVNRFFKVEKGASRTSPSKTSSTAQTSQHTTHLRGRTLRGTALRLPLTGVLLEKHTRWEQVAGFDEVVVWGHEQQPDGRDPYVSGVAEWVELAAAVHGV